MNVKYNLNTGKWIAGITLKDETAYEQNNMALHVCKKPNDIIKNRQRLADVLQVKLENFVCSNQTHSANFHKVTTVDKGRGAYDVDTAIPNVDAMYTYEPNIVLCCFSADCVPVTFYNKRTGVVGIIHSGWQGSVKEITLKLFRHLVENENCNSQDFYVYLGSCLSQKKFEVDKDVKAQFAQLGYADEYIYFHSPTNKYHIDNQKVVKKQCDMIGIPESQITLDSTCTFMHSEGFSYRQDKQAGRHLSFIVKKY